GATLTAAVFGSLGGARRAASAVLAAVVPGVRPRPWGGHRADGASCVCVQSGTGFDGARGAAAAAPPVRRMVACGCAGALVESLRAGDLVAADGVVPLDAAGRAGTRLPAGCTPLAPGAPAAGLGLRPAALAPRTPA